MSVQWVTPRNDPDWISKSADGYYAIADQTSELPHRAYFIEAVWATPEWIGDALNLAGAQRICETHRREQRA
jgi:hypothetical protein